MAKYRYAQTLYGRVIYIYDTDLPKNKLSTVFDPSIYWIDVTGIDCEVGYKVSFMEGVGITFTPPVSQAEEDLCLDELKAAKIEELKAVRKRYEKGKLEYNGYPFDYDDTAQERINGAIDMLEGDEQATIDWTLADNTEVAVRRADLKALKKLAGLRNKELHDAYKAAKAAIELAETKKIVMSITL